MQKCIDILRRTAVYLTAVLCVFYLFSLIVQIKQPGILAGSFFLILAFCLVLALAQELFYIRALPVAARCGLHFACFAVSFIFLYILSGNYAQRGSTGLFVATVLFCACYGAVLLPCLLIYNKRKQKKQSARSNYQKIYK